MQAIVIERPGGPEVLTLREVPTPAPQRGEVRVRVRGSGVNRADLLQRQGLYPAPPDVPAEIPGLEFAGEIDAVGDGVTRWQVGDRVFGLVGGGAYAEMLVAHADTMAAIPPGVSFTDAAALPEAFITAWDAMVSQAGLQAGETVLIHAAGSGVGTAAVQIARAIGARALGTARTASKLTRAATLGLEGGIVAQEGKFAQEVLRATRGRGVDVVLELVGGDYCVEDLKCVAPRGRIVLVGLLAGRQATLDLGAILRSRITLRGTQLRGRSLGEKIQVADSFGRHVVPLFATGTLKPIVERLLPLGEAAQAHELLAGNSGFGKLVLAPS